MNKYPPAINTTGKDYIYGCTFDSLKKIWAFKKIIVVGKLFILVKILLVVRFTVD